MACLMLVHGLTTGGWIWRPAVPLLRRAGHEVFTPTLTGLGEREHLLDRSVGLATHVEDVANALTFDDLERVVLVGHSYGGMVISGVAELVPERLRQLVFLDALAPADGQAVADLFEPAFRELSRRHIEEAGAGWLYPPTGEVRPRQRPHPARALFEPLALGRPEAAALPRAFIHCTGKDPADPSFQGVERSAARARREGWRYLTLATDHEPMWTDPEALAALLGEVAG